MRLIDPRRNLEIKATCPDPVAARDAGIRLTGQAPTVLRQVDTYFDAPRGRLKLREIDESLAELIYYERPDHPAQRISQYHLVLVPDPEALKALLSAALGVGGVVRKRRELLLYENVRIHLDAVENLGNFIELEAVLSETCGEVESRQRLERLTRLLHIRPEHRISHSYGQLVRSNESETPR